MYFQLAFYASGAVIALMLVLKKIERKHQKTLVFSKALSLGDKHIRNIAKYFTEFYYNNKEKFLHYLDNQLPLKTKSNWNKFTSKVKDFISKSKSRLQSSRMIKSTDEGITEFFKTLSEKERELEDRENNPFVAEEDEL